MISNFQHASRKVVVGTALSFAVFAAAGLGPLTAFACGLTVSQDLTLEQDLTGCEGDGILVVADGVSIDLNGHSIIGARKERTSGIRAYGVSGLTIKNGTIAAFERGINLYEVTNVSVSEVEVSANRYEGLMAYRSKELSVIDSSFANNSRSAIWIYDTDAELIGNLGLDNPNRTYYISGGRVTLSGNIARGGAYYSAFTLANGYLPGIYSFSNNLAEDVTGVGYLFASGFTGSVVDLGGNRAVNTGSLDCWTDSFDACPLDLTALADGTECGDGLCEGEETVYTCSYDCGAPPPETCDDGIDNDGDGAVDCDDAEDCALASVCEPAPLCEPPGASCSSNDECCSGVCRTTAIGRRISTCR